MRNSVNEKIIGTLIGAKFELQRRLCDLAGDNRGAISIEIVLLIVVLIALVAAFKTGITTTLTSIMSKIGTNASKI
ncbi:MAG: hypothetical protein K6E13_01105 [Lachnospiraceae bacterium]|nr:hypothetical protein [Lachnospiraceae bacterium]